MGRVHTHGTALCCPTLLQAPCCMGSASFQVYHRDNSQIEVIIRKAATVQVLKWDRRSPLATGGP